MATTLSEGAYHRVVADPHGQGQMSAAQQRRHIPSGWNDKGDRSRPGIVDAALPGRLERRKPGLQLGKLGGDENEALRGVAFLERDNPLDRRRTGRIATQPVHRFGRVGNDATCAEQSDPSRDVDGSFVG